MHIIPSQADRIGWFVFGSEREPSRLLLELDGAETVEVHTGPFRLDLGAVPADFDMAEYGRYEFGPVPEDHVLTPLLGWRISRVRTIAWRDSVVGIVVDAGGHTALMADLGDEVFVSSGVLPAYPDDLITRDA